MRQRTLIWVPLGLTVAVFALLGLRYAHQAMQTTESEVILYAAERYLAERREEGAGETARLTDCQATPGRDPFVWLVVECAPGGDPSAGVHTYEFSRMGQIWRSFLPRPEALELPGEPRT